MSTTKRAHTLSIHGEAITMSAAMWSALCCLEYSDTQPTRRTGDALCRRGLAEYNPATRRYEMSRGAQSAFARG